MPSSSDRLRRIFAQPALVLPLALASAAGALGVSGWGEPHLATITRTAEEAERVAAVTAVDPGLQRFEDNPAGAATVRARPGPDAFSFPSGNISFEREMDFKLGNALFTREWVSSPSSTQAADGIGPLFNARACQSCHTRDSRGHPPEGPEDDAVSIFLRLSVPDPDGGTHGIQGFHPTAPDPIYGGQLQDFAIHGHEAEGRFSVVYAEMAVPLSGGEVVHLRRPTYEAAGLTQGPLAPDAMLSPRVAPQMIGLGLLEAVPEADILALADEDDVNGDGISGRPNVVRSAEFGQPMLGRFGHKAGTATVREQSAAAFSGDMGLSTSLFPILGASARKRKASAAPRPPGGSPRWRTPRSTS